MSALPPDPEGMNDARADWAAAALHAFQQVTGTDDQNAVTDLLCDLMHWCDRNGEPFEIAFRLARMHYEAETMPEDAYYSHQTPPGFSLNDNGGDAA